MKIAIHHNEGSFSERWIYYCETNNIPYKVVSAYSSSIIEDCEDCAVFMWHFHHANYKEALFAKQLIHAMESAGKVVFPNINTCMHFDDKVAQKYLFECFHIPAVPAHVFYDFDSVVAWIENAQFPQVFKLRGGASSSNVSLVHNKKEAYKIARKAFTSGFSAYSPAADFIDRFNRWRCGHASILFCIKGLLRIFLPKKHHVLFEKQKSYVYFQEFIPKNDFDIRIVVIGNRAFGIKRLCRENDFRASGGGRIVYDKDEIPLDCVRRAFFINEKLRMQCAAMDFVLDEGQHPLLIEVSYGFASSAYDACPGYWDSNMKWHEGKIFPHGWMIEDLLKQI